MCDKASTQHVTMDFAFLANESSAGQTAGGTNVKSDTLPDHPGERPTKAAHIKWCQRWCAALDTAVRKGTEDPVQHQYVQYHSVLASTAAAHTSLCVGAIERVSVRSNTPLDPDRVNLQYSALDG